MPLFRRSAPPPPGPQGGESNPYPHVEPPPATMQGSPLPPTPPTPTSPCGPNTPPAPDLGDLRELLGAVGRLHAEGEAAAGLQEVVAALPLLHDVVRGAGPALQRPGAPHGQAALALAYVSDVLCLLSGTPQHAEVCRLCASWKFFCAFLKMNAVLPICPETYKPIFVHACPPPRDACPLLLLTCKLNPPKVGFWPLVHGHQTS